MRYVAIVGLVLFGLASPDATASRIICLDRDLSTPERIKKRLDSAAYVILGRVADQTTPDVKNISFPEMPEIGSMDEWISYIGGDEIKEYSRKFDQVILFDVLKLWKGAPVASLEVRNHAMPGQYGYFLERGATYLVFVFKDSRQSLVISTACGATIREDNTSEEIKALDDLVSLVQPTNNALH